MRQVGLDVDLLYLQRQQGYQAPQKITIPKKYHSWPFLASMGPSVVRLTLPDGI